MWHQVKQTLPDILAAYGARKKEPRHTRLYGTEQLQMWRKEIARD
jgi:phosphoglycolate phosphatase-like HAD superfamily hydrolase